MNEAAFKPDAFFALTGKTLFVTGAGGQIGGGIVAAALAGGANIVATDADAAALDKAKTPWPAERVVVATCDIRSREQIESAMELGAKKFGQIDALVNNAGASVFEPYLERSEESIDLVMDVNLKGTLYCTLAFAHHRMNHGGGGAIVNIASHYGLVSPDPRIYTDCARRNSEIYGATKAGVIQMTKYYAVQFSEYAIRVNAVTPGGVRNPVAPQGPDFQANYGYRCPMGRMAEIPEIVGAVVFLLSPAASYVNGHNLVVDGGFTSW